jgi:hypothetical protein
MTVNTNPFHVYVQNALYVTITVYDRWGGLVYEREDYDPNGLVDTGFDDYLFAWNGETHGGISLPFGIYSYRLKTENCTPAYKLDFVESVLVYPTASSPIIIVPGHSSSAFNSNCCPTSRVFDSNAYGSKIIRTSNSIVAQTNYNVTAGQDVVFDAGESITLKPGFRVNGGGKFHCKISGCVSGGNKMKETIDTEKFPHRPLDNLFTFKDGTVNSFFLDRDDLKRVNNLVGVYPNPLKSRGNIFYSLVEKGAVVVEVMNIYGIKLYQAKFKEEINSFEHSFSSYPVGVYLINFKSRNIQKQ